MSVPDRFEGVGKEWKFDVHIDVIRERRRASKDAHRFKIATAVLGGIALGVVSLGCWGLAHDDFAPVGTFWTAAGPILGTIVGFYFGKTGDDS